MAIIFTFSKLAKLQYPPIHWCGSGRMYLNYINGESGLPIQVPSKIYQSDELMSYSQGHIFLVFILTKKYPSDFNPKIKEKHNQVQNQIGRRIWQQQSWGKGVHKWLYRATEK